MKMSTFIVLTAIFLAGCSSDGLESVPYEPYRTVNLHCTDLYAGDGDYQVVINDQSTLDSFIYEHYQRPLDEWYQSVVEYFRRDYPGLSDSAYAALALDHLQMFPQWNGTVDCSNPSIDFSTHTLLGQTVSCGGCGDVEYTVNYKQDYFGRYYTFSVQAIQHGYCDMGWETTVWLLVPKIPRGYSVRFETQTEQRDS
jgi:hypothetical protein